MISLPSSSEAVLVLLSTYQGAEYLGEFLDSLAGQTIADWRLLVRDDGSTDATLALLAEAAGRDPRIQILTSGERLGACGSFSRLMETALLEPEPYIALADQDDVWLPEKLGRLRQSLQRCADRRGSQLPVLAHCDLEVVDSKLQTLHPSFARLFKLRCGLFGAAGVQRLLTMNSVTGCASMLNRPLLRLTAPVPAEAVMHDWWAALCAAAVGEILWLPEPMVRYRQHGGNLIGARKLRAWNHWRRSIHNLQSSLVQASAFRRRVADVAPDDVRRLLDEFCSALERPMLPIRRYLQWRRLGVLRKGLTATLVQAAQLHCLGLRPMPSLR